MTERGRAAVLRPSESGVSRGFEGRALVSSRPRGGHWKVGLLFEFRRHAFDGVLYLCPGFIHVSLELRPCALISAFQLVEVFPCFRLFGAQYLDLLFILGLGVPLDLLGRSCEAFGLRLPRVQLLFHQRLIIFPNSHDLSPAIALTFISVIAIL